MGTRPPNTLCEIIQHSSQERRKSCWFQNRPKWKKPLLQCQPAIDDPFYYQYPEIIDGLCPYFYCDPNCCDCPSFKLIRSKSKKSNCCECPYIKLFRPKPPKPIIKKIKKRPPRPQPPQYPKNKKIPPPHQIFDEPESEPGSEADPENEPENKPEIEPGPGPKPKPVPIHTPVSTPVPTPPPVHSPTQVPTPSPVPKPMPRPKVKPKPKPKPKPGPEPYIPPELPGSPFEPIKPVPVKPSSPNLEMRTPLPVPSCTCECDPCSPIDPQCICPDPCPPRDSTGCSTTVILSAPPVSTPSINFDPRASWNFGATKTPPEFNLYDHNGLSNTSMFNHLRELLLHQLPDSSEIKFHGASHHGVQTHIEEASQAYFDLGTPSMTQPRAPSLLIQKQNFSAQVSSNASPFLPASNSAAVQFSPSTSRIAGPIFQSQTVQAPSASKLLPPVQTASGPGPSNLKVKSLYKRSSNRFATPSKSTGLVVPTQNPSQIYSRGNLQRSNIVGTPSRPLTASSAPLRYPWGGDRQQPLPSPLNTIAILSQSSGLRFIPEPIFNQLTPEAKNLLLSNFSQIPPNTPISQILFPPNFSGMPPNTPISQILFPPNSQLPPNTPTSQLRFRPNDEISSPPQALFPPSNLNQTRRPTQIRFPPNYYQQSQTQCVRWPDFSQTHFNNCNIGGTCPQRSACEFPPPCTESVCVPMCDCPPPDTPPPQQPPPPPTFTPPERKPPPPPKFTPPRQKPPPQPQPPKPPPTHTPPQPPPPSPTYAPPIPPPNFTPPKLPPPPTYTPPQLPPTYAPPLPPPTFSHSQLPPPPSYTPTQPPPTYAPPIPPPTFMPPQLPPPPMYTPPQQPPTYAPPIPSSTFLPPQLPPPPAFTPPQLPPMPPYTPQQLPPPPKYTPPHLPSFHMDIPPQPPRPSPPTFTPPESQPPPPMTVTPPKLPSMPTFTPPQLNPPPPPSFTPPQSQPPPPPMYTPPQPPPTPTYTPPQPPSMYTPPQLPRPSMYTPPDLSPPPNYTPPQLQQPPPPTYTPPQPPPTYTPPQPDFRPPPTYTPPQPHQPPPPRYTPPQLTPPPTYTPPVLQPPPNNWQQPPPSPSDWPEPPPSPNNWHEPPPPRRLQPPPQYMPPRSPQPQAYNNCCPPVCCPQQTNPCCCYSPYEPYCCDIRELACPTLCTSIEAIEYSMCQPMNFCQNNFQPKALCFNIPNTNAQNQQQGSYFEPNEFRFNIPQIPMQNQFYNDSNFEELIFDNPSIPDQNQPREGDWEGYARYFNIPLPPPSPQIQCSPQPNNPADEKLERMRKLTEDIYKLVASSATRDSSDDKIQTYKDGGNCSNYGNNCFQELSWCSNTPEQQYCPKQNNNLQTMNASRSKECPRKNVFFSNKNVIMVTDCNGKNIIAECRPKAKKCSRKLRKKCSMDFLECSNSNKPKANFFILQSKKFCKK